jgi:hypothetical protein
MGEKKSKKVIESDESGAGPSSQPEELMDCDAAADDGGEEGWENVSLDLIKWNILLKQIEDLSFLSTILAQKPRLESPMLPLLPSQAEELSVVSLLDKGKGML